MAKLTVNNYDELAARLGEKLGESEWLLVDQERINLFADATLDHQWIHVDTERAAVESQFKSTIPHFVASSTHVAGDYWGEQP